MNTIAIIGAGNGGFALAAHLSSMGACVNLYDLYPQYIEGIKNSKEITLILNKEKSIQRINNATSNIREAIEGAELIMVVTPAFTHKQIAKEIAPFLSEDQKIVLNPGRTAGAVNFLEELKINGCSAEVIIGEAQTLIYSCRKLDNTSVEIFEIKKQVDIGVIPINRTDELLNVINEYFSQFVAVSNTLVTSLSNIGSMFHPLPVLLNLGWVENKNYNFKHYWEGISPSVAKMIETLDRERIGVAQAYGIKILDTKEWLKKSYSVRGDDLYELLQSNNAYKEILAPTSIDTRYLLEDVPTGLVPISELGRIIKVPTPNIDATIILASSLYDKDFIEEGRNLKKLNLFNKEDVIKTFEYGV
ncbi:putative NAD/nadp octopine/nopaline dehydrogenase [Peptoniphilus sp. ING2-D1G]|nr:putative NAD/nadp octopine/nopaline dehydrogenase [Peptoniphilus sp. ING2-D1G]